jgi:hypothetical protein
MQIVSLKNIQIDYRILKNASIPFYCMVRSLILIDFFPRGREANLRTYQSSRKNLDVLTSYSKLKRNPLCT